MRERIKKTMSDVFNVDIKEIDDDISIHSIDEWNSMKHMQLMLALEKEFKIHFDDEEIPTMTTFDSISITIKSYIS